MNKVTFVIKDRYLLANESLHPQPIANFIPNWYKNMQISKPKSKLYQDFLDTVFNVKSCPSFVEIYKEGYVIPAPHDYLIKYDYETENWSWKIPVKYDDFKISANNQQVTVHNNKQMLDHINNVPYKKIFKLNLPYKVVTSKNISIRQMPIPYIYQNDWEALYGVFRSDKIHEINIQIGYKTKEKEIIIKQGEPLCLYIPFQRQKYNYKITDNHSKEANIIYKNLSKLYSSFNKNFKNLDYYLDT